MKKNGIINIQLAGFLAGLGHKDTFMIADAGMPIPKGIPIVDLALTYGIPTFPQVMDAVLKEVCVEHYIIAEEITQYNQTLLNYIEKALPDLPREELPHAELKKRMDTLKFVIRTGEDTPYPNIILTAGCAFFG